MNKTIQLNVLDEQSIKKCIKEINKFREDVLIRTRTLAKRMAEYGVDFAHYRINSYDAIDTGELFNSIKFKAGDVIVNYRAGQFSYIVYTDCPYAGYVEFGTGMLGLQSPHPTALEQGWDYDVHNHGWDGWYYQKDDGTWHWSNGYYSRPFMLETYMDMAQLKIVQKIAREVFG